MLPSPADACHAVGTVRCSLAPSSLAVAPPRWCWWLWGCWGHGSPPEVFLSRREGMTSDTPASSSYTKNFAVKIVGSWLTRFGLIQVLRFAFTSLDPILLHGQGARDLQTRIWD